MKLLALTSVEFAQHVALCVERSLRSTTDPEERDRLRNLRDWHYAQLADDQIRRRA